MHEFSLAQALLEEVDRVRHHNGGGRLRGIRVEVGELCGVEADLLASAVEMILADGPDAGTSLELHAIPVEARCRECGREFRVQQFHFLCPDCGDGRVEVIRGEGLVLRNVTIETIEGAI